MKALIRIKAKKQLFRLKEMNFESKEDILKYIWNIERNNIKLLPFDKVIINLKESNTDNYKAYKHCSMLGHYCFAKGRITVTEFAAMQFTDDYLIK